MGSASDRTFEQLLKELRGHRKVHGSLGPDGGTAQPGEPRGSSTCQKILRRLKRVLPKLTRHLQSPESSPEAVRYYCLLVGLLLEEEVCPHSHAVFDNGSVTQVFPSILALLSLAFAKKCESVILELQRTITQLVLLLGSSDPHCVTHILEDAINLNEDLLLVALQVEEDDSLPDHSEEDHQDDSSSGNAAGIKISYAITAFEHFSHRKSQEKGQDEGTMPDDISFLPCCLQLDNAIGARDGSTQRNKKDEGSFKDRNASPAPILHLRSVSDLDRCRTVCLHLLQMLISSQWQRSAASPDLLIRSLNLAWKCLGLMTKEVPSRLVLATLELISELGRPSVLRNIQTTLYSQHVERIMEVLMGIFIKVLIPKAVDYHHLLDWNNSERQEVYMASLSCFDTLSTTYLDEGLSYGDSRHAPSKSHQKRGPIKRMPFHLARLLKEVLGSLESTLISSRVEFLEDAGEKGRLHLYVLLFATLSKHWPLEAVERLQIFMEALTQTNAGVRQHADKKPSLNMHYLHAVLFQALSVILRNVYTRIPGLAAASTSILEEILLGQVQSGKRKFEEHEDSAYSQMTQGAAAGSEQVLLRKPLKVPFEPIDFNTRKQTRVLLKTLAAAGRGGSSQHVESFSTATLIVVLFEANCRAHGDASDSNPGSAMEIEASRRTLNCLEIILKTCPSLQRDIQRDLSSAQSRDSLPLVAYTLSQIGAMQHKTLTRGINICGDFPSIATLCRSLEYICALEPSDILTLTEGDGTQDWKLLNDYLRTLAVQRGEYDLQLNQTGSGCKWVCLPCPNFAGNLLRAMAVSPTIKRALDVERKNSWDLIAVEFETLLQTLSSVLLQRTTSPAIALEVSSCILGLAFSAMQVMLDEGFEDIIPPTCRLLSPLSRQTETFLISLQTDLFITSIEKAFLHLTTLRTLTRTIMKLIYSMANFPESEEDCCTTFASPRRSFPSLIAILPIKHFAALLSMLADARLPSDWSFDPLYSQVLENLQSTKVQLVRAVGCAIRHVATSELRSCRVVLKDFFKWLEDPDLRVRNEVICVLRSFYRDYEKTPADAFSPLTAAFSNESVDSAHTSIAELWNHFHGRLHLYEGMITVNEQPSTADTELLLGTKTAILASLLEAIGAFGCMPNCENKTNGTGLELLFWSLVTLLEFWSKYPTEWIGSVAFQQAHLVLAFQKSSLRSLMSRYPKELFPPIVRTLLRKPSAVSTLFVELFLNGEWNWTDFLANSCEYVLPQLVLQQDEQSLIQLASSVYSRRADGSLGRSTSLEPGRDSMAQVEDGEQKVAALLRANLARLVLELMMSQVETGGKAALHGKDLDQREMVKEWDFLLRFFSEGTSIRDLIRVSSSVFIRALVWEFGGDRSNAAHAALKRTAEYLPAAGLKDSQGKSKDRRRAAATATATGPTTAQLILRQKFLLLMTDLNSKMLRKGKNVASSDRIRALKCIQKLLTLVGSDGLDPYIPKVMATLKQALQAHELRDQGIEVWKTFVLLLSDSSVAANLSSIVVSLLPFLPGKGKKSGGTELSYGTSTKLHLLRDFHPLEGRGQRDSAENAGMDPEVSTHCQSVAVEILEYLFIEKRRVLKSCFDKIPFLSQYLSSASSPELDRISTVLLEELGDQRELELGKRLPQLVELVGHESPAVRKMALQQLLHTVVDRERELQLLVLRADSAADVVNKALMTLLRLTSVETETDAKLSCAEALGAIGAIDPARLLLLQQLSLRTVGTNEAHDSSLPSISKLQQLAWDRWVQSGSGTEGQAIRQPSNHLFMLEEVSFGLIENFLVQALKAAPETTDHIAYAIQELLRFLATRSKEQTTEKPLSKPRSTATTGNLPASIPGWVRERLDENTFDIVEPYWTTNYSTSSASAASSGRASKQGKKLSPHAGQSGASLPSHSATEMEASGQRRPYARRVIYSRAPSFDYWIVAWAKELISGSTEDANVVFSACRGVLRSYPSIARALLPHIVINVLLSQAKGATEGDEKALPDGRIVDEILCVLEDLDPNVESNSKHHVSSQVIFSLIDDLREWVACLGLHELELEEKYGSQPDLLRPCESELAMEKEARRAAESLLEVIPTRLLSEAAVRIEAHARALRYFETYVRQNEPAFMPGVMPTVSADEYSFLQKLYSKLDDDPDGLLGLAAMKRKAIGGSQPTSSALAVEESSVGGTGPQKRPEAHPIEVSIMTSSTLFELRSKIIDYEHSGDWSDALMCYEKVLEIQERLLRGWKDQADPRAKSLADDLAATYAGMLRCMKELGHYETVLHIASGIMTEGRDRMLLPVCSNAVDAAWRLGRWEELEYLTEKVNSISSGPSAMPNLELSVGQVLLAMKKRDTEKVRDTLKKARLDLMGPLAAASMESYQRTIPLIQNLHFLFEAEQGYLCVLRATSGPENKSVVGGTSDVEQKAKEVWHSQLGWDNRAKMMVSSMQCREPILALRRLFLKELGLHELVSKNWLQCAKIARDEHLFQTATKALLHAEVMIDADVTRTARLTTEASRSALATALAGAKVLYQQGQIHAALQRLEPVELDVPAYVKKVQSREADSKLFAKALLCATNWMQESGQKQGTEVIARYKAVITLQPAWEKGYFSLGKYFDFLLEQVQDIDQDVRMVDGPPMADRSGTVDYIMGVMMNYSHSLRFGTKYIFQSLPRFLTLYFECGEALGLSDSAGRGNTGLSRLQRLLLSVIKSDPGDVMDSINAIVKRSLEAIPTYMWLTALPQLVSRICHPNSQVVELVMRIIVTSLCAYPQHAMWNVVGLSKSQTNLDRRRRAEEILVKAKRSLIASGREGDANTLQDCERLFDELIKLAKAEQMGRQRRMKYRFSKIRSLILAPRQNSLTVTLPETGQAVAEPGHDPFPHNQIYIQRFNELVDVMNSKEKPKRISVQGSDGLVYSFLCKREQHGDLRKDARMMEFNTMINRLLQRTPDGRRRKLRLRTYAVICLDEQCGLLEWVPHTSGLRQLVQQVQRTEQGIVAPFKMIKEVKTEFEEMQAQFAQSPTLMAQFYREHILSRPAYSPRFHAWFLKNFPDPTTWFESRLTFVRSAAAWSMVGHVVGLGDRHGENLLIDTTNGECVHVDFDCLFDKGLSLARPEIVPFRLTPNMIDAFGLTGYEGVYRRVCEITMALLRENRGTLLSVLEAFIHDPLVEWSRVGRHAQQVRTSSGNKREVEDAKRMLYIINERLKGVYNYHLSNRKKRPHSSSSNGKEVPPQSKVDTLPLSVQGQVHRLIQEAVSEENLAQMYFGWMPFL